MSSLAHPAPRVKPKPLSPRYVTGELTAGRGRRIEDLIAGVAVLSVLADDTSEFYWARAVLDGGRIACVVLQKFGSGSEYQVAADPETGAPSCTCADATYRGRACKHITALTQALSAVAGEGGRS